MEGDEYEVQVYCEKAEDHVDAIAVIHSYTPAVEACIHKAPEDCYPAEPEEIVFSVLVDGEEVELSEDECKEIDAELSVAIVERHAP